MSELSPNLLMTVPSVNNARPASIGAARME